MLQDLKIMLVDYYNINELTDTGQRELNKLMNTYASNISLYRDLVKSYKQLLEVA